MVQLYAGVFITLSRSNSRSSLTFWSVTPCFGQIGPCWGWMNEDARARQKTSKRARYFCTALFNRGTDFCRMLEQKYFSVTIKFQTIKTFLLQATDKCPATNSSRKEVGRQWQIWSVSYDQVTKYLESYIFFFKKSEEFKEGGYAMRNMLSFS